MIENENQVIEQVEAEQVEQVTETPKTYTQEEVNAIVGKREARTRAKIEKEYQSRYGALEGVLRAGTGKQSVEEITDTLSQFYRQKGIQLPQQPNYSQQDIEVLAKAEADEIIRGGYDDVVEEVDRLTAIGAAKMTAREKAVFRQLAEHRQNAERSQELIRMGVPEEVYSSAEFRDFASKFSSKTPITEVYGIYQKTQPKKEIRTMGSMKQSQPTGAKDFYTPEEIARLTMEDLDDPKVWEAVRRSMTGR